MATTGRLEKLMTNGLKTLRDLRTDVVATSVLLVTTYGLMRGALGINDDTATAATFVVGAVWMAAFRVMRVVEDMAFDGGYEVCDCEEQKIRS